MLSPDQIAQLKRIEIATRRRMTSLRIGEYRSGFRGQGIEFEEVRPYAAGDDVRAIDWNVTARSDEPYIKLFREERELSVWLCVDVSPSLDFGTQRTSKRQTLSEAAALVSFSAIASRDRVGLVRFTDRVEGFLPPRRGRNHGMRVLRDVFTAPAEGRGTDLTEALGRVGKAAHHRAVVFVMSDYLGVDAASAKTAFARLARQHDVVPVCVTDPRERELPNVGLIETVDPETGARRLLDTSSRRVRRAYAEVGERLEAERDALLRATGLRAIRLTTGEDVFGPVHRFFAKRNAQRENGRTRGGVS